MKESILIILMLSTSVCFGAYEGVWTGDEWMADSKILFAKARPITISVDTETGEQKITGEKPDGIVAVRSCVEYDGGRCEESEYFKVTIHDIKG